MLNLECRNYCCCYRCFVCFIATLGIERGSEINVYSIFVVLFLLNITLVVDVDDDSVGGGTTVGVVHGGITVIDDVVVVVFVLYMVVLLWLIM